MKLIFRGYEIKLRQWSSLESNVVEERGVKVGIRLRSLLIHSWSFSSLSQVVKGFENLLEIDEIIKNGSQYVNTVCLIACQAATNIPMRLKTFVGINSFVAQVDIMTILFMGESGDVERNKGKEVIDSQDEGKHYDNDKWER